MRHHPDDTLLMGLSSGRLAAGHQLVVAAHIERCPRCASRLREFDALGGALLDELQPASLSPDALARTLRFLDAASAPQSDVHEVNWDAPPPGFPAGMSWPRALRGSSVERWRRLGAHLRFSRVRLPYDPEENVYLLRAPAGRALPVHRHRGSEVTYVLHGAFDVGRERFGIGDFAQADDGIHHQPVVTPAGECICLIAVEGRVAFDGSIARVVGSILKM